MAQFHIGDIVRIDGTKIKAPITHISHGSGEGDTIRYKVKGRYWSENSVSLIKAAPAKDSVRKAPARLHRALDAVLDARPARDARKGNAKDLNTTPPRDALASQAKARAWLESLQERMQPAYAAEDKARERYKNASSDQRDRYDLEKKWDIASAKVAQLEKEWDQAHAAVKRAIPGFEW
jgi:hypothetical protein